MREDYVRMKKGLDSHINAICAYLDEFTDSTRYTIKPDFKVEIERSIMKIIGLEKGTTDDAPWFEGRAINKLWDKINK